MTACAVGGAGLGCAGAAVDARRVHHDCGRWLFPGPTDRAPVHGRSASPLVDTSIRPVIDTSKAASQEALLGSLGRGEEKEILVELKGIDASHTLAGGLGQLAGSQVSITGRIAGVHRGQPTQRRPAGQRRRSRGHSRAARSTPRPRAPAQWAAPADPAPARGETPTRCTPPRCWRPWPPPTYRASPRGIGPSRRAACRCDEQCDPRPVRGRHRPTPRPLAVGALASLALVKSMQAMTAWYQYDTKMVTRASETRPRTGYQ